MRTSHGVPLVLVVLASLTIGGCAARAVTVADLRDRPGRFEHRTVSITGVVTSSWGLPLVPFKFYKVDDGTGEITVLSQSSRNAPTKGARLRVRGRIGEVAQLGGQSLGLHIEERGRNYRDR